MDPIHTLQAHYFPVRVSSLLGVVIVSGICYWAYNKYQAYKTAQNESDQVDDPSESEEMEVDLIIQRLLIKNNKYYYLRSICCIALFYYQ